MLRYNRGHWFFRNYQYVYGSWGLPKSELVAYFNASNGLEDTIGECGSLTLHNAVCATVDTATEFQFSELAGSETVTSSGGTSTPTVSAGKITFTAGTVWKIELDNGWMIPVSEGDGTVIHAYDEDGNNYVGTLASAPAGCWTDNTQDDYFHDWLHGKTENRSDGVEIWNDTWEDTGWVDNADGTYTGTNVDGTFVRTDDSPLVAGELYEIVFDRDVVIAGGGIRIIFEGGASYSDVFLTSGSDTIRLTATNNGQVYVYGYTGFSGDFSISINNVPVGKIPGNPHTGFSCLGQTLTHQPHDLRSVSFAFPYATSLAAVDTAKGGDVFYDSADGTTPLVRSYWAWRLLSSVNLSTDGQINIAPQRIAIYSSTQTDVFERIQKYIKNLTFLGGLGGTIDVSDNNLSEQEVDDYLCYLASAGDSDGTLDISGNNAAPSATGTACKNTLVADGWTVTVTT